MKRLEAIISGESEQDASAHADRLASSFGSAPVEKVSAEEMQEESPEPMAMPQRCPADDHQRTRR